MADLARYREELRRQAEDLVSRFMASDQGQKLIGWYETRGERDRLALRMLALFLGAVFVYMAVVAPLLERGERAERRLEDERALLAWLRSHEADAKGSAEAAGGVRDQPVATLVNTSAQDNKLTIRRYEPAGEDGIRVWVEGAPFNAVVKWIAQLEGSHGVRLAEFDLQREGEPGQVSARLTFRG